jgi:hypothetical protein
MSDQISIDDVDQVLNRIQGSGTDIESLIQAASRKHGVSADLIRKVIQAESAGNPRAVSKAGAKGLMQLMPQTAAGLGVTDPFDPKQSVMGGTQFLKQQLDEFRDERLGLAAYNMGPAALKRRQATGEAWPDETTKYVGKITGQQPATRVTPTAMESTDEPSLAYTADRPRKPGIKPPVTGGGTFDPLAAATAPTLAAPEEQAGLLKRQVLNAYTGLRQGLYSEAETINNIVDLFAKATGAPKSEWLTRLVKEGKEATANEAGAQGNSLVDKVVRGAFAAAPTIAELMIGTPVLAGAMKAAKLPTAIKLGSTAVTQGKKLLSIKELEAATKLAKASGKTLRWTVPLAEPLAFGGLEAGKEAVRPEATLGSTTLAGLEGLGMGTALPLIRALPHVARELAAGGIGAGMAGIGGATPEEMITSGVTMSTLAGVGEAAQRGISKLLKKAPPPTETAPTRYGASDEVKEIGKKHLDAELANKGYKGHENWSDYQKWYILENTPGTTPLPTSYDTNTGKLKLELGRYSSEVPKDDPTIKGKIDALKKAVTEKIQKGTIVPKEVKEVNPTKMDLEELYVAKDHTTNESLKKLINSEIAKREAVVRSGEVPGQGLAEAYDEHGRYWASPMAYIKGVLGESKNVSSGILRDLIANEKLPAGKVTQFIQYLREKGYKAGVEPLEKPKPGEISSADVDYVLQDLSSKKYNIFAKPNPDPATIPTIGNTGKKAQSNVLGMKKVIRKLMEEVLPSDVKEQLEKWSPERNEMADTIRLLRKLPRRVLETFPEVEFDETGMDKWLDDFLRGREVGTRKWGLGKKLNAEEFYNAKDVNGKPIKNKLKIAPFENYKGEIEGSLPEVIAHDIGHWVVDRLLLTEFRGKAGAEPGARGEMPYKEFGPQHEGLATLVGQVLLKRAGITTGQAKMGHGDPQLQAYLKMIQRSPSPENAISWVNIYRNLQDMGVLKRSKVTQANKVTEGKKFAETPKVRMARMNKEVDEFYAQLANPESAEFGTEAGMKELIKTSRRKVTAGAGTYAGAGLMPEKADLRGKIIGYGQGKKFSGDKEGFSLNGWDFPQTSEEALDRGKLMTKEQAKELWDYYKSEDAGIKGKLANRKQGAFSTQSVMNQTVENQLRREMVESYLGASKEKSMTWEQIEKQFEEGKAFAGKGRPKKGTEVPEEVEEGQEPDISKMSVEDLVAADTQKTMSKRGAAPAVLLHSRSAEPEVIFTDPKARAAVIQQLHDELRWNKRILEGDPKLGIEGFSDKALQQILENGFGPGEENITLSTPQMQKLTPGVLAKGSIITRLAGKSPEVMADVAHLKKGFPKWVVTSINWENVSEVLKKGKLKENLLQGEHRRRGMEEIDVAEAGERPTGTPTSKTYGKLSNAPIGEALEISQAELVGELLDGRTLPSVIKAVKSGYPLKEAPQEIEIEPGRFLEIWKDSDRRVSTEDMLGEPAVKSWFLEKLSEKNKGESFPRQAPMEQELKLVRDAMPGLKSEMLADKDLAEEANRFTNNVQAEFRKIRDLYDFQESAKRAFWQGWKLLTRAHVRMDEKTGKVIEDPVPLKKQRLATEIAKIIEETPDIEKEGLTGIMAKKASQLTSEEMEQVVEYERRTAGKRFAVSPEEEKIRAQKAAMMTPLDKVVAEAGKQKDLMSDYASITDKMKSIGVQEQGVREQILKASLDRDAATGTAKDAPSEQLGALRSQQKQLVEDWTYLSNLRKLYSRTTNPYERGTEAYIEVPLTKAEHGIDGSIISKGDKKGSVFSIVQGANGAQAMPGEPGHSLLAKADVTTRRTKGEIVSWDVPKGIDPRVEDALYNSILERYTMRADPINIKNLKGVAEEVRARRVDVKFKPYDRNLDDPVLSFLPEDSEQAKALRAKKRLDLREAADLWDKKVVSKDETGKLIAPDVTARELKDQWLRRAISLTDGTFDYDLEKLRKSPGELGMTDPAVQKLVEYMPLADMIGDPTQSRILPVARVGNLAQQAEYSINNYISQYVAKAEYYLGKYRNDAEMKSKIMRHLHSDNANKPEWKSKDPAVIEAAQGYRNIMEDLADLFKLKEKGLYRSDYASIVYDMEKLWESYGDRIAKADKLSELPDSLVAKIKPEDFDYLHGQAMRRTPWKNLTAEDRAAIMDKFFSKNLAYDKWELLPEPVRDKMPKEKFNRHFQHRDANSINEFAMNEDIWDVTMRYIHSVVHDGVMNDWFLPKANNVARLYGALGANETTSVRGYLDRYIRQVAGFDRTSPATKFMNDMFANINKMFGKQMLPEAGGVEGAANLYQSWLYRGALGIDTAVRNLTQSIYTVAELGPYNWVKGLSDFTINAAKKTETHQRFKERQSLLEEFFGTRMEMFKKGDPTKFDKLKEWDRKLTALVLSPMRITENINRGIAYYAGLAEAAEKGLPFEQGHVVGYKGASTMAQPLEMSEAEWFAEQKKYKTQFGYGKTHTSPLMQGNLMRFFTPFWSFPVKTLQYWSNLGKGSVGAERWTEVPGQIASRLSSTPEGEPYLLSPKAAFPRFLALTGFLVAAPALLSETLGIDAGYLWGKGLFPNQFTPMWMEMLENIHVGVFGGMGMSIPPTEKDKSAAWKGLANSMAMLGVPQWRFGSKVDKVVQNMEKGYYAMGPSDLPAVETTFAKEVVNLFGFPPMTRDAKSLVWDAYRERANYLFLKQDALKEAAGYWEKGDFTSATKVINNLYSKHNIAIKSQDINDFIRRQNTTTAYEEAEKHMLKERKGAWASKLRATQQQRLPGGAGKRSLWMNTAPQTTEEPEPEEENGLSSLIGR